MPFPHGWEGSVVGKSTITQREIKLSATTNGCVRRKRRKAPKTRKSHPLIERKIELKKSLSGENTLFCYPQHSGDIKFAPFSPIA